MNEFNLDDFVRLVVNKLEELEINIILDNPDTSETFPCGVVSNPMENIISTDENLKPIKKYMSITVEWWSDKKYDALAKFNMCNSKLKELNMLQRSTPISMYDDITKKHRFGCTYEVSYNGLTNSLEKIK